MKLILISESEILDSEIEQLIKMFDAGLPTFHLRKKNLSNAKIANYIDRIPVKYHNRITLHSNYDLAYKYNVGGIHLRRKQTGEREGFSRWLFMKLINRKRPNLKITTSYKRPASIFQKDKYEYEYVFLSPVYDKLHDKFLMSLSDAAIKDIIMEAQYRIIARGGIDINNIHRMQDVGFYGIAFYSCIWKKENPVEEFKKVLQKFEELGIPVE